MAEIVISIFLSIISLVGGALIAVNINYAANKADAIESLKGLGKSSSIFIFRVWVFISFLLTLYYLGDLLLGDEEVTKSLLIRVVFLVICIFVYVFLFASLLVLSLFRNVLDVQNRHLNITEKAILSRSKIENGEVEN
ncbi:MAG: hypothetical protein VX595_01160 [Pseudomonadota bacterium]|uniref:hypothetical protein n=1 Tax=Alcanivorax sp. NBRC 102024 TaxID=1113895 RepID=UPI000789C2D9|nr:hypothetical protein [Alcanivorax sp. NBRC 102024]MEE2601644.1 hypothetical protein [Pseudomonadota bacterium]